MAKQLFINNFEQLLVGPVKDAPTSGTPATELDYGILRLSNGAAGTLLDPGTDYYVLTLLKRSGSNETNIEIVKVTDVDNSTPGECRITVTRAQEGTTAKSFIAGDYATMRFTKGSAENMTQAADLSAHAGSGGVAHANAVAAGAAGFMTGADKTKLDAISGTNTGDNAVNTTYANDYRAANFVAGTNYVAPGGALGTPASGALTSCTADGTNAVGFRHIPQVSQSAAYTLVLTDAGKHILHPSADTTARIFTIPANSSVAFAIGTAVTFVNQNAGGVITIAITTDTMRLAGAGTTGSRTLAANGVATAVKLTSTEWIISGTGLT